MGWTQTRWGREVCIWSHVCKPRFWHLDPHPQTRYMNDEKHMRLQAVLSKWFVPLQLWFIRNVVLHLLIRSPVLMHCRGIQRMLLTEWEDNKKDANFPSYHTCPTGQNSSVLQNLEPPLPQTHHAPSRPQTCGGRLFILIAEQAGNVV